MVRERDLSDFTIVSKPTADVTAADRSTFMALFDSAYRDANHAYLEKSLARLRCVALATHDGEPAGFALGEMRVIDLPRLPHQEVMLAGICCIASPFRRRGLFGALERSAVMCAGVAPRGRWLMSGRMAHPASFHLMTRNPTHIPKPGVEPTPWQQEIGQAIADAYGVGLFDPKTFVCHGSGEPIGHPIIDVDAKPDEWRVFEHVDRDRGDSLLGMAWSPDAPQGW
jgi:hypothetical protein